LIKTDQDYKEIQIKIKRGDPLEGIDFGGPKTIRSITITDNGVGFNNDNFNSFETPFSKENKQYGCKGVGRFTILAAFEEIYVKSNYKEGGQWKYREFKCNPENEVVSLKLSDSTSQEPKTVVLLDQCFNPVVKNGTALTITEIAQQVMHHCLIYYLSGQLPVIRIFDEDSKEGEVINDLFDQVSREKERNFKVKNAMFSAYITKVPKANNRKHHYIYYCANSRVVGQPHIIGKINSLFSYPLIHDFLPYFLEVYVVSEYLNLKNYRTRNGFSIPQESQAGLWVDSDQS
jgi:hypothetical protein